MGKIREDFAFLGIVCHQAVSAYWTCRSPAITFEFDPGFQETDRSSCPSRPDASRYVRRCRLGVLMLCTSLRCKTSVLRSQAQKSGCHRRDSGNCYLWANILENSVQIFCREAKPGDRNNIRSNTGKNSVRIGLERTPLSGRSCAARGCRLV